MTNYSNSCIYQHDIDDLYELIMDIENYPKFLPWCKGARITSVAGNLCTADLVIGFKGINYKYCSEVMSCENKDIKKISVKSTSGIFKSMHQKWILTTIAPKQTKIDFFIDFHFKYTILYSILDFMLEEVSASMLKAFEDRANLLYGSKHDGK